MDKKVTKFCALATTLLVTTTAQERAAIALVTSFGDLPGLGFSVNGSVTFTQSGLNGSVLVQGTVSGLRADARIALVVYETGDLTNGCSFTGPQPYNHKKLMRQTEQNFEQKRLKEAGDAISYKYEDSQLSLFFSPNCILGRTVAVYDAERDKITDSSNNKRIACGVIGIKYPAGPWFLTISSATLVAPGVLPGFFVLTLVALFLFY